MFEGNKQLGTTQRELEVAQYALSIARGGAYDPDATKVTKVANAVGTDVKRTFAQMCDDHNKSTDDYMAKHIRGTAPAPLRTMEFKSNKSYGDAGIDQSTLEVFNGYNLDFGTMTAQDEKKLRLHYLLSDDERKLKRYELVALLKVKMLDEAARLKDIHGPQPVQYSHPNPASYKVNHFDNTATRLQRQTGMPQYVAQPGPYFTQPQQPAPQPEKKGFFSKVGSSIASAASKLKFW